MNDYGPDDRARWFQAARQRVRAPGLMLQVFGTLAVAVGVMLGGATVANPDGLGGGLYDWMEGAQKNQPPAERQKLPPRDEFIQSVKIEGPVYGGVSLVAGLVMFIGGWKMKELKGYGWSMAGSIAAIFPGLCCCCLPVPFGIWALVVLLNPDVKLAFSRAGSISMDRDVPPDDRPIGDNWEDNQRDDRRRDDYDRR